MIGFKMIEVLAAFVEAFLGIWINTEVLGDGAEKKKIAVWASGLTCICWAMNQYKLFSIKTTIVFVILLVLISCLFYKCRIVDSIVLSICYMVVLYIIDFIAISAFGLIWSEEQIAQFVTSEISIYRICIVILSKFLLVAVFYTIWKKWLRKIELPVRKLWISVVLVILLVFYLGESTFRKIDVDILLAWLFFLGIIVIAVYAAIQYLRYEKEKSQLDLALERSNMQLAVYNQLIKDYQNKQIFYHDLKNQYLVIRNFIRSKEYEQAERYLEALETANSIALCEKRTGIPAVDILIACKIKEAVTYQIQVDIVAELLNTAIPEQELIALLGNSLDNAIEACQNMQHGSKWIRLYARNIQEMTIMKIENSYEKQPIMTKGHLLSFKEDSHIHGFGMKSIKAIVEKNDGKMKMDYADGVFTLVISFFN